MASYDRSIPPGGEGKITLRLKTKGYDGKIRKGAKVYTNDPKASQEFLIIEALVRTPIVVSDKIVLLQGTAREAVTRTVEIRGKLDKPLKLEPVDYTLDKKVTFSIEELTKEKHYRVTFTSIPNVGNSYRGLLRFRTSYPEKPELMIYVRGNFIN